MAAEKRNVFEISSVYTNSQNTFPSKEQTKPNLLPKLFMAAAVSGSFISFFVYTDRHIGHPRLQGRPRQTIFTQTKKGRAMWKGRKMVWYMGPQSRNPINDGDNNSVYHM